MTTNWLDRAAGAISPTWDLNGVRVRQKLKVATAHAEYEGATLGRRANGWRRTTRDANGELSVPVMAALRGIAHDLVRNNPVAARGTSGLAEYIVGVGITFQIYGSDGKINDRLTKLARRHLDGLR